MIPETSLEQWAAFKAVVDEGSFAAAADTLNKSQSSVSYAVARLEARLPVPLFRKSGRKAELTDTGKVLYRHACSLLQQALDLDTTAAALAAGWESEIVLAIDALVPRKPVFQVLHQFTQAHPQTTRVRIMETTLSGTEEALLLRQADLVISSHTPPGFLGQGYGEVVVVAVAAPEHPLLRLPAPISERELRQFRQIVISDSGSKRVQDRGWLAAEHRWTVSHFNTAIEALKVGLGFSFVPEEYVQRELASGQLKCLPLVAGSRSKLPLSVILTAQSDAGPAANALANALLGRQT